jgi:hypothetical protein
MKGMRASRAAAPSYFMSPITQLSEAGIGPIVPTGVKAVMRHYDLRRPRRVAGPLARVA